MADLAGKTIVITGANTGLGRAAALQLAPRGPRLILACRSRDKTEPVLAELRACAPAAPPPEFLALDLASLASVREAAAELRARAPAIDVLVNNAGVAGHRGLTADGFELQFGVNHLGHYLWTRLLLDAVAAAGRPGAPARLVTVASNSHRQAKAIDWDAVRRPTATVVGLHEYEVSKLCNLLMQRELTRRLGPDAPVHTYALNPGRVATDAWRRIPGPVRWLMKRVMISSEQGGSYLVHAATEPAIAAHTGRYYDRAREQAPTALAQDDALALELWTRSAAWVDLPA
ncbi:MAG: SDR family NAD(P)-dependent oxidoreductase [Kofleriaceae bacterium]